MAEVFGFPPTNLSLQAERYRTYKLCPYNNKVPNCTKDKADNPLGVCSVFNGDQTAITCPIRFRQDWLIAEDAARFFFPDGTTWTSLTEVRLNDAHGKSAGNIDIVLVAYDSAGKLLDFGALEVQAVYISGNVRRPFDYYMQDRPSRAHMDWTKEVNYPRPDYLSSSRKRLAPQLLFKGGILNAWGKKIAVALDKGFFATLPTLQEAQPHDAEIAWLVYDLHPDDTADRYSLTQQTTIHTTFTEALEHITRPDVGDPDHFLRHLQAKLDEKLENNNPPDTETIDLNS
ncbi:MAG: NotI family restriction endonuclease [Dehalococcoidia bacterium]|nr:NotI family restriction endonuclease [Dehalococcoidia bacterium]